MKREEQTNHTQDVLANVGDSLREWAPSLDEERGALDRVWTGLRWKAKQVPAEAVRSVELGPALSERRRVEGLQPARWNHRSTVSAAAAAAMVIVAVGGAIVWPRGARVYAAGNDGLQVTLSDDSSVEMRAHSEMTVGRASDGIQIDLKTGDIIVTAARPRDGHLSVRTKDMIVGLSAAAHEAKADTVFLVNAGQDGSRVAVIEGEVRVREQRTPLRRSGGPGDGETRLRPGEQVATSAIGRRPLAEDITWSRNAAAHRAILESFTKGMAQTAGTLSPVATPRQSAAADGQAASSEFEEESIRKCDPDNLPPLPAGARGGGANSFYMTPGRTYALCMTLATLVRTAYGYGPMDLDYRKPEGTRGLGPDGRGMNVNIPYGLGVEDGRRVRGAPDWVLSERYTIEAVAGGSPNAETMRGPMLQALLVKRFRLKAHIESEQAPAFTLKQARGGIKIKPAESGACEPMPPGDPSAVPRRFDAVRRGEKPSCGFTSQPNGPNHVVVAGDVALSTLAQWLGGPLGDLQVTDQTGRTDKYNFVLEFVWDGNTPGRRRVLPPPGDHSGIAPAPTIYVALEEQLGLSLEPAKASREFIVIDHVERPGPN